MSDTNEDIPVIVEPESSVVPANMDNNLQTIEEQTKTEGRNYMFFFFHFFFFIEKGN